MKALVLILFLIGLFLIGQGFMIQNMVVKKEPTSTPTPTPTPTTTPSITSPAPTNTPSPNPHNMDDISNLSPILPQ